MAGVSFPVSFAYIQLLNDLDAEKFSERIKKLEDPISFLHDDIPAISEAFYAEIRRTNYDNLKFEDVFYEKFSRPIAVLKSKGFIVCAHALGRRHPLSIRVSDATYIMYLCELFEDSEKMEKLVKIVDDCKIGEWLDGKIIAKNLELPIPVAAAVFDIFEEKGYGIGSDQIDVLKYCRNA